MANIEWDDLPDSIQHLSKKHLSATHLFEIEIKKAHQHLLIWSIRDWNNISTNVIPMILKVSKRTKTLIETNKSVQGAFDKMIEAKTTFENAGGMYEGT